MPQSLSNTLVHIIFSTKNRMNLIDDEIEERLFGCLGKICNESDCKTIIIGGFRNHVHILCNLNRRMSQSELVKILKTNSSRWIKTQGEKYQNFYWQDGYAVFSVSQSNSTQVVKYIQNQREHHSTKSFKEEYLKLLELNKISFEEKYMWN